MQLSDGRYKFVCRFPKYPRPAHSEVAVDELTVEAFRNKFLHFTRQFALRKSSINLLNNGHQIDDLWLQENYKPVADWDCIIDFHVENLEGQMNGYTRRVEWIKRLFLVPTTDHLQLGTFIENREKFPLDYVNIDLSNFAPHLRTFEHARLTALQWKFLTDGDDEQSNWRHEKVTIDGVETRRFPILSDMTLGKLSTTIDVTVLTGSTQSKKSTDIAVLNWLLPRLGYLVVFLSRKKNGESTINNIRTMFDLMAEQGKHILYYYQIETTNEDDTKQFLKSSVLNSKLKSENKIVECYVGKWKHSFVIAGLQTMTYILGIGFALAFCMKHNMCKTVRISDEDDEVVGSYDARGSNVEYYGKIDSLMGAMERRLQSVSETRSRTFLKMLEETSAEIERPLELEFIGNENEITTFEQKRDQLIDRGFNRTFRQFVDMDIRITSTAIPCIHNSYETNCKINVLVKHVPENYHGYAEGHFIKWKEIKEAIKFNTSEETRQIKKLSSDLTKGASTPHFMSAKNRKDFIEDFKKGLKEKFPHSLRRTKRRLRSYLEERLHPDENQFARDARTEYVLRQFELLRKNRMKKDAYSNNESGIKTLFTDAINDYNSATYSHVNILLAAGAWIQMRPMELVCEKTVKMFGETGLPVIGFVYNSDKHCSMYFSIADTSRFKDANVPNIVDQIELRFNKYVTNGSTERDINNNIVRLKIKLSNNKHRSTHLYYDIANHLSILMGVEKPFFVCVSGGMAERQAVFKDSNHRFFLTHMLVSFNSADQTMIVQKVVRLTGVDPFLNIERKLYCDKKSWNSIEKALILNRRYMQFFANHPGKTVQEAISFADESMKVTFKEMMNDGRYHRESYSKQMNIHVPELLPPEYKQQVEATPMEILKLPRNALPNDIIQQLDINETELPNIDYRRSFENDLSRWVDHVLRRIGENSFKTMIGTQNDKTWRCIADNYSQHIQQKKSFDEWVVIDQTVFVKHNIGFNDFVNNTRRYIYLNKGRSASWRATISKGRHLQFSEDTTKMKLAWR